GRSRVRDPAPPPPARQAGRALRVGERARDLALADLSLQTPLTRRVPRTNIPSCPTAGSTDLYILGDHRWPAHTGPCPDPGHTPEAPDGTTHREPVQDLPERRTGAAWRHPHDPPRHVRAARPEQRGQVHAPAHPGHA